MNLWYIWQDEQVGYDAYDSAVVAAEDKNSARSIHPYLNVENQTDWKRYNNWASSPKNVYAKLIGSAVPGTKPGLIIASYNAG